LLFVRSLGLRAQIPLSRGGAQAFGRGVRLSHVIPPPWRIAAVSLALLAADPARAQGFFGPTGSPSYQPEVDAYFRLSDGLRLQAQVQPYFVPQQQVAQVTFGLYGSWYVAAYLQDLLSPDEAKKHSVDMRLGVLYTITPDPGTGPAGNVWTLQFDLTPRYSLPGDVLLSLRNRVSFNWQVDGGLGFFFLYRGRFQVEREFDVGGLPLTPFVNVEFFWQQPPAMWTQFRIEGGLQLGFEWFARGQTIEVNYSAITNLQPGRSWSPQIGLILSSYF
jgi:hypothetical protein